MSLNVDLSKNSIVKIQYFDTKIIFSFLNDDSAVHWGSTIVEIFQGAWTVTTSTAALGQR